MIERHWKGISKRERAYDYILHLRNDTFKEIDKIEGFIYARILKREVEEGIEFLIITSWESFAAIKMFAGPLFEKPVIPPAVRDIMITYDEVVVHYELYI